MKSVFPSWYRISANVDRQPRATLPKERERERENVRPTAPLSCPGTQVDDHRSLFCLVVQALAHVVPGCAADLAQGLVGHGGRRLERSGGVEELRLCRAPSHHLGLSIHTSPGRGAEDGIKFSLRLGGGVGGVRGPHGAQRNLAARICSPERNRPLGAHGTVRCRTQNSQPPPAAGRGSPCCPNCPSPTAPRAGR